MECGEPFDLAVEVERTNGAVVKGAEDVVRRKFLAATLLRVGARKAPPAPRPALLDRSLFSSTAEVLVEDDLDLRMDGWVFPFVADGGGGGVSFSSAGISSAVFPSSSPPTFPSSFASAGVSCGVISVSAGVSSGCSLPSETSSSSCCSEDCSFPSPFRGISLLTGEALPLSVSSFGSARSSAFSSSFFSEGGEDLLFLCIFFFIRVSVRVGFPELSEGGILRLRPFVDALI